MRLVPYHVSMGSNPTSVKQPVSDWCLIMSAWVGILHQSSNLSVIGALSCQHGLESYISQATCQWLVPYHVSMGWNPTSVKQPVSDWCLIMSAWVGILHQYWCLIMFESYIRQATCQRLVPYHVRRGSNPTSGKQPVSDWCLIMSAWVRILHQSSNLSAIGALSCQHGLESYISIGALSCQEGFESYISQATCQRLVLYHVSMGSNPTSVLVPYHVRRGSDPTSGKQPVSDWCFIMSAWVRILHQSNNVSFKNIYAFLFSSANRPFKMSSNGFKWYHTVCELNCRNLSIWNANIFLSVKFMSDITSLDIPSIFRKYMYLCSLDISFVVLGYFNAGYQQSVKSCRKAKSNANTCTCFTSHNSAG